MAIGKIQSAEEIGKYYMHGVSHHLGLDTHDCAVREDLGAGRPMDRLICGDVGFGKTEVALRASFIAAMNGVQVAVVADTVGARRGNPA